jgi:hypothetical protein
MIYWTIYKYTTLNLLKYYPGEIEYTSDKTLIKSNPHFINTTGKLSHTWSDDNNMCTSTCPHFINTTSKLNHTWSDDNNMCTSTCPHFINTTSKLNHTWSDDNNMCQGSQHLVHYYPTTACPLICHKTNMLHNDLKKDTINEFGIKYWTSNPVWVIFQEHGSFFYVTIEEKVWLLVRKIPTWKDWQGD